MGVKCMGDEGKGENLLKTRADGVVPACRTGEKDRTGKYKSGVDLEDNL